jgi:hypothetical protein
MITVLLRGGLGNQMFQYALGLRLAKKNQTGLTLDTTFLNDRFPRKEFSYRTYDLDVFDIDPRFTLLSKITTALPIPGVWLGLDFAFAAVNELCGLQKILREKLEGIFDPTVLDSRGNALLWGFWQSEKYFADVAGDVRTAFQFRDPFEGEVKALAEKIGSCNAVSLHVRRGDYLSPKYASAYGATDLSYYERALKYVAEHAQNPTIFIFSDDIDWCRENVKPKFPTVYVDDATRGAKASGHLKLMSLCKHNIIANSSFSWWGAWLNQNPSKIIVAPKQWYARSTGGSDITPASWIRI